MELWIIIQVSQLLLSVQAVTFTQTCQIFDGVSKLICDPDTHVKNGAELLDRLVKDIVTESNIFDVDLFVTLVGTFLIYIENNSK